MPYYQLPPGNMKVDSVPMFVTIGWDDNCYSDGLNWIEQFLKTKKNPGGLPARNTFFCIGDSKDSVRASDHQSGNDVINAWKALLADGHELGNHSYSHPHGSGYSQAAWASEMSQCDNVLTQQVGEAKDSISGFRTPYLEYGPNTIAAVSARPFLYDCSIEFGYNGWTPIIPPDSGYWDGMSDEATWKKLFWPFTMNNGIPPGNSALGLSSSAGVYPNIWEFMVYTLKKTGGNGVITGMDYNCWGPGAMSGDTYYQTLKYNLDLRRAGNKCPFTVCCHTDNYSDWNTDDVAAYTNSTVATRRKAMEDFITYALSLPDVRMVTFRAIINWMRNPVSYSRMVANGTAAEKQPDLIAQSTFDVRSISRKSIEFSLPANGVYTFSLISLQGRMIENHTGFRTAGTSASFPIKKAVPSGAYIVCLSNGSNIVLEKTISIR